VARLQGQLVIAKEAVRQSTLKMQSAAGLNGRIAQLTELAGGHQLQIDGIEPGEPVKGTRINAVPLRVNGRGGFRNLAALLAHVRTELPDLGVDQIDLTAGPAGGTPSFTVRFQWFTEVGPMAGG
jgi:Tfp pilus assembly protein PilO